MPKSVTLAEPSSSTSTFWGLTSRWTMLARVRGAERAGDLDRVGDRLVDRQPAHAADALLQRLALDVLEDDVRAAVLLAGVDHADDVRVGELGDGARLAAEALELVGVRRDLAVHQLDRDLALERRVERAVDRRHPAGPDLGVEAVPAVQAHADERAHRVARIVADSGTSGHAYADRLAQRPRMQVRRTGAGHLGMCYPPERRHRGWRRPSHTRRGVPDARGVGSRPARRRRRHREMDGPRRHEARRGPSHRSRTNSVCVGAAEAPARRRRGRSRTGRRPPARCASPRRGRPTRPRARA